MIRFQEIALVIAEYAMYVRHVAQKVAKRDRVVSLVRHISEHEKLVAVGKFHIFHQPTKQIVFSVDVRNAVPHLYKQRNIILRFYYNELCRVFQCDLLKTAASQRNCKQVGSCGITHRPHGKPKLHKTERRKKQKRYRIRYLFSFGGTIRI